MSAPSQDFEALVLAVRLVMAKWATLNHAIEEEWAGSDSLMMKRLMENDLLANIQERWNNTGNEAIIYKDEISDFILDEMGDVFNCDLEDGSNDEIADIILSFYNSSRNGDMSVVNSFIEKNQNFIPGVENYLAATRNYAKFDNENQEEDGEFNSSDYEEVNMEEEEEVPKNQPDEDGWTVVQ